VTTVLRRVVDQEEIDIDEGAVALIARHATGSFRDALGTLEQLVTYAGGQRIESADVLAVLGIADSEQLFAAIDAVIAANPAAALRAANTLAESGRDPGQVLRDLEVHGRELLTVQVLGEVPDELRVTVDRDRRLADQAKALPKTDAVRLLDLVSLALDATANGAQARIQLELVLIKAAAPEVDPSTAALLARIERLEERLRSSAQAPPATATPPTASPAAPLAPSTVPAPEPKTEAALPPRETPPAGRLAADPPHAPAATAAVTGGLGLDTAISSWPAVLDLVKGQNSMLATALAAARPVAVGERELTLAFPGGASFLKRKAEQDEHRRVAAEALRTVTGHRLALRYELRDDEVESVQTGEPALSGEELVRRFMEEFDAEEIGDDQVPNEGEASG
jgi:DNA polymerase-3 subunit gamma/tau